ncbi:MAG TPA: MaoC/PaaZ C-terminal domain-containing protein [Candidatus Eisenbacteria bacterium]|nr:MaoC/PaaZ C-terminal domain-containing protein [Candidatus Eisenbacteria bacterium]
MSETRLFGGTEVHVGQDVGGRTFAVTADAVERYREGTASAVATGDVAPALTFHSECYRDLAWYLPNLIGNLHARQEWELFRPFRIGDTIRSRTTVVERYRKRNRNYVVAEVLLTDQGGAWLQRSRTHQSFLADDPGSDLVVDREREKRSDRRFELPAAGGESIALAPRTITHAMCEAFSGPVKNYHTDVEMARALGFPDIVVQGMMSVCFTADLVTERYGMGFLAGGKLDVRLVNVVWPGDAITARGTVREVTAEGSRRRAHLDVWCEKADGTVTIIGAASAFVAA